MERTLQYSDSDMGKWVTALSVIVPFDPMSSESRWATRGLAPGTDFWGQREQK